MSQRRPHHKGGTAQEWIEWFGVQGSTICIRGTDLAHALRALRTEYQRDVDNARVQALRLADELYPTNL